MAIICLSVYIFRLSSKYRKKALYRNFYAREILGPILIYEKQYASDPVALKKFRNAINDENNRRRDVAVEKNREYYYHIYTIVDPLTLVAIDSFLRGKREYGYCWVTGLFLLTATDLYILNSWNTTAETSLGDIEILPFVFFGFISVVISLVFLKTKLSTLNDVTTTSKSQCVSIEPNSVEYQIWMLPQEIQKQVLLDSERKDLEDIHEYFISYTNIRK